MGSWFEDNQIDTGVVGPNGLPQQAQANNQGIDVGAGTSGEGWTAWAPGSGPADAYNASGAPLNSWDTQRTGTLGTQGSGDPTRDAVMAAFAKKGIQPRDAGDVQYWVDAINKSGGMQGDNAGYWTDRMANTQQGGVGDYQQRPESGSQAGVNVALPNAPTYNPYTAPTPFQSPSEQPAAFNPQSTFGSQTPFAPTSSFGANTPFQGGSNVPTPTTLTQQNLATPDKASYTNFDLPPGFVAPTAAEASQDPGYQFRQQQAQQQLENSAASKGMLRTNNTWQGLQDQAGQLASQEYGNVYNRRLGEAQTSYNNAFQTNQANNAGNLAVNQANAQTGLNYGQANNANTLAFGQANNQSAAAAQAAQFGQNAQAYGLNQAAQNQEYGQQLGTYGQNQSAQNQQYQQQSNTYQNQLAGQNQGYNQAANTYGMNTANAFNTNQANNQGALANYQAQVNAALGQGQLQLGQGNLALNQSGQQFNQGLALNQNSYNQQMGLAQLGNPGAPNSQGYGQTSGDIYAQQGNALAAGQVGAANANTNALGQLGNAGMNAYALWLQSQKPPTLT